MKYTHAKLLIKTLNYQILIVMLKINILAQAKHFKLVTTYIPLHQQYWKIIPHCGILHVFQNLHDVSFNRFKLEIEKTFFDNDNEVLLLFFKWHVFNIF